MIKGNRGKEERELDKEEESGNIDRNSSAERNWHPNS